MFVFFVLLSILAFILFFKAEFEMERFKVDAFLDIEDEAEIIDKPPA
jgi:hypothetical protein